MIDTNENAPAFQENDDEISLIDLFAVLLKYKWMIVGVTAAFMLFAVVFSVISLMLPAEKSPLPNQFTPKAEMLIKESQGGNGGISAMLNSSGLGGLAGLAGISSGGATSSLASYLVQSDSFLDSVTEKFDIIERYKIEKAPIASSRKALKKVLKADYDEDTGVFTVSFKDIDPLFACEVVNYTVTYLENRFYELGLDTNLLEKKNLEDNIQASYEEILRLEKEIHQIENSVSNVYSASNAPSVMLDASMKRLELSAQQQVYTSLKGQYEILKINLASETPLFQVLERAQVPDQKSEPSRGKLCIILTFAGGFISVFLAFLLNALKNIKNDPEAMRKLTGK